MRGLFAVLLVCQFLKELISGMLVMSILTSPSERGQEPISKWPEVVLSHYVVSVALLKPARVLRGSPEYIMLSLLDE